MHQREAYPQSLNTGALLCSAPLQSHSQFVRLGIVNKERAGGSAFLHQFVVCNAPASLTLKNLQTPQWVIWKQLPASLKYDQLEDGNNSSRCQLGYKYKSPHRVLFPSLRIFMLARGYGGRLLVVTPRRIPMAKKTQKVNKIEEENKKGRERERESAMCVCVLLDETVALTSTRSRPRLLLFPPSLLYCYYPGPPF